MQRFLEKYLSTMTLPRSLASMLKKPLRSDFVRVGEEFLAYLRDLVYLQPSDIILDVGCGGGRIAIPLVRYIAKSGEYYGFDVNRQETQWCRRNIARTHPNFHFAYLDIYNQLYNPTGRYCGSTFKFPYPTNSFDVVFLISIFTHLTITDIDHYLAEIRRVLKPHGRYLITHFLLTPESTSLINRHKSYYDFERNDAISMKWEGMSLESGVAYDEAVITNLYTKHQLAINALHYGSWCGRSTYLSFQDIIIGEKK